MKLILVLSCLISMHLYSEEEVSSAIPLREISIIASDSGYYPATVAVFKGEKVRFFLTTTSKEPTCFLLPEKELSLGIREGKIAEAEAYFGKTGSYNFFCPASSHRGKIVVLEKKSDILKEKEQKREVASTPLKVWMPKDE